MWLVARIVLVLVLLGGVSGATDSKVDMAHRGQLRAAAKTLDSMKTSRCHANTDDMEAITEAAVSRISHRQSDDLWDIAQQEVANLATTLFTVADGALKLGCRQVADYYYRRILSIFTGSAYEAYRQRALVGIEDVRRAR
jgi:hypothetical protein